MASGKIQIAINAKDKASGEMKKVGKSTQSMGDKFKKLKIVVIAAAAAITAFVVKALTDWARAGDEIAKMADRTGVAVESLSELKFVLGRSGASLSDFETATKKLSKAIVDAGDGLTTYLRAFERLGLDVEDLSRMSMEDQFWAVATALAEIEDTATRTATAVDLFGRSGTNLMPMLLEGAEGIAELKKLSEELSYQWTAETAAAAERLTDSVDDVKSAWDKLKFTAVDELGLDIYIGKLAEAVAETANWVNENEALKDSFIALVGWVENLWKGLSEFIKWFDLHYQRVTDFFKLVPGGGGGIWGQWTPYWPDPRDQPRGGETFNININGNVMGDEQSVRELASQIASAQSETRRGTSFSGVNRAGYFPGSSSI